MVKFITLQTNHGAYDCLESSAHSETGCLGGCDRRRRVSIAYSDKRPDVANLLGNLEHQDGVYPRGFSNVRARRARARKRVDCNPFPRASTAPRGKS